MIDNLSILEIKARYYSIINKLKYILFFLFIIYPIYTIIFLFIVLIINIIECIIINDYKENTIIIKYKNTIIGFINGSKNYIHKAMVLPNYQGNGFGKKLFNSYIEKFCKNYENYYFKTSILLDTLRIFKKYKNCTIDSDNYFNYKITCQI